MIITCQSITLPGTKVGLGDAATAPNCITFFGMISKRIHNIFSNGGVKLHCPTQLSEMNIYPYQSIQQTARFINPNSQIDAY